MGKMIKVSDAAEMLGVHRQTIENWGKSGVLTVKCHGNMHYVDEDVVIQLGDFASDVEKSRLALEQEKAEYDSQRRELRHLRSEMKREYEDLNNVRRYKNLCVKSGIRSDFFTSVLRLMHINGDLNYRESTLLERMLEGEAVEALGEEYGLTRQRIWQVVNKAIRKSQDLTSIQEKLNERENLLADIESMKAVIADLRYKLGIKEVAEKAKKAELEEEVRKEIIENDQLCKLLSRKLVDYDLTVRALNCLKSYRDADGEYRDVETLGDLVRLNKTDLLKQRNLGKKTLIELDDLLDRLNLCFGMDVDKIFRERIELKMQDYEIQNGQ